MGRSLYFSSAGLAELRVIANMEFMLVDNEQTKELGREFAQSEIGFFGRQIMPEERVLVARCVVMGNQFQGARHQTRGFTSCLVIRGAVPKGTAAHVFSPTVSLAMRVRNTFRQTMSSSRVVKAPSAAKVVFVFKAFDHLCKSGFRFLGLFVQSVRIVAIRSSVVRRFLSCIYVSFGCFFLRLTLDIEPGFKSANGFALERQLDVSVDRLRIFPQ